MNSSFQQQQRQQQQQQQRRLEEGWEWVQQQKKRQQQEERMRLSHPAAPPRQTGYPGMAGRPGLGVGGPGVELRGRLPNPTASRPAAQPVFAGEADGSSVGRVLVVLLLIVAVVLAAGFAVASGLL